MISRLAKDTVEMWKREGLEPTFDDIVKLNALGLKLERNSSSYEFASVPRVAFLGDYVFTEPTVGKRMWLESAMMLLKEDFDNQLTLTAYALSHDELPELNNVKKLVQVLSEFRKSVLADFTDTQIFNAIDYALRGNSQELDEEETNVTTYGCNNHHDIPESLISSSKLIYQEALAYGISEGVKDEVTLPALERIVILAALHSGVDVLKGEHAQRVGAFYKASGKIHERLKQEKLTKEHSIDG